MEVANLRQLNHHVIMLWLILSLAAITPGTPLKSPWKGLEMARYHFFYVRYRYHKFGYLTCPLINHLNPFCWFSNIILLLHLATSGQPEQMVHCRVSHPVTALSCVWNLTKLTERFEDHDLVKFAVILGSGDTCPLSSLTNLIFPHRSSALTSGDCYWGRKVISSCVCKVCLTATFSWASLEKILCSLHENHS